MDKSKKIDKEFVLSDSTLNVYGFRLLTEGYMMDMYAKNPIGYYMHDRDSGVVLKWEDLRIDGDKVMGKPVINMSNPRGQQTIDEVENGFLNAASVGHIVVVDYSTDPDLMLPGQTGPTVTKWYNRECSLVDIPGNNNALTQLYDEQDNLMNLADFNNLTIKTNNKMNAITLTAEQLKMLNLSDNSDAAAVTAALKALADKAALADNLQHAVNDLKAEKTNLQLEINKLQGEHANEKVKDLLDKAIADKKITAQQKDLYAEDYKGKPERLETVLKAMPAYTSVTSQLQAEGTGNSKEQEKLEKMSWDEIHKTNGLMAKLKEAYPELYATKYEEKYGKKPTV